MIESRRVEAQFRKGLLRGLMASTALLLSGTNAWAAPGDDAVAGADADATIVVTAQRRQESLEDVPMSVVQISGDILAKTGTTELRDLGNVTPGLLISNGGYSTQPSIRGVTTTFAGNYYENNVAVYIDGIYQSSNVSVNSDFVDVASVQVLKGPQGSLYGRNATGGAILITTQAPSDTFKGMAQASYAQYDEKTFSAYLSGPIAEGLRFSVSGYSRDSNGYYKLSDPVTGAKSDRNAAPLKKQYLRAKIEADLTSTLTATLGYNHYKYDDGTLLQYSPFAYIAPTFPKPPISSPAPLRTKAEDTLPVAIDTTNEVTLNLVWNTAIGTVRSTSAYTRGKLKNDFDLDGTYQALVRLDAPANRKVYQTDFNYEIDVIDDLNLIVGANYFKKDEVTPGTVVYSGGNPVQILNMGTQTEAFRIYADASYRVTDRFTLIAGGGYAWETAGVDFAATTPALQATGGYLVSPVHKDAEFRSFTPRASIRYEVAPRTNLYASYSRGFKSGLWQTGNTPTLPARPETVDGFELGFKTARPGLQFETAAFYYKYKNIQTSVTIPNPLCQQQPCNIVTLILNGPAARIYGIDGQVSWQPTDRISVQLGGAYLHARFRDFPNATGTGVNPLTNTIVPNQQQDWSGQQLPRAPDFSANLSVDYRIPVSFGEFSVAANAKYTTSYVVSNASLYGPLAGELADRQRYRQSEYVLLNGSITWTDPSERYSLQLFARNLTNKRYWSFYSSSGSFGDYGVYAPPRVIGASVKVKFE